MATFFDPFSGQLVSAPDTATSVAIGDVTDIDTSTNPPVDGQALVFNSATGTWEPGTVLDAEGDPIFATSTAASITGADKTNWNTAYGWGDHKINTGAVPADGQNLSWDAATSKWIPKSNTVAQTVDTVSTTPVANKKLGYTSNNKWEPVDVKIQEAADYATKLASSGYTWLAGNSYSTAGTLTFNRYGTYQNASWTWYQVYVNNAAIGGNTSLISYCRSNMVAGNSSSLKNFNLKWDGVDHYGTAYIAVDYGNSLLLRFPRAVGVNPDTNDWWSLGIGDVNNTVLDGKTLEISVEGLQATIPIADKNTLLYNATRQKFEPNALATVATSGAYADLSGKPSLATVATTGDYNDLINVPSGTIAGRVTSVNTASSGVLTFTNCGTSGALLSIFSDLNAWIVLYGSATARTNDAGRAYNTDPVAGSGVLAEVYVTAGSTVLFTPVVVWANNDTTETSALYLAVRDQAGASVNATVTLKSYPYS